MIAVTDTVVDERAVVVKTLNTFVAVVAMPRLFRP